MKFYILTLSMMSSALVLTACAAGKARPIDPAQSPPPMAAPSARPLTTLPESSLSADQDLNLASRLSRLESDVASMKLQMVQIGPILEKMPALQDKLSELVQELQRIDARVVSAQNHASRLPESNIEQNKVETVEAVKSVPVVTPTIETTPKPAPSKGLMMPVSSLDDHTNSTTPVPTMKPSTMKVIPQKAVAESSPVSGAHASSPQIITAKKPSPVPAAAVPTSAVATTTAASIRQVRVGDDAEKTRVVLDVSRKIGFTYDLDNAEKIMIIDLEAPEFLAPAGADFSKSPLVASYTAQAVAGGKSRLILQLRTPVDVVRTQNLPPNGDKGDRIVLDLARAKS